jgi:hypothetical protein
MKVSKILKRKRKESKKKNKSRIGFENEGKY